MRTLTFAFLLYACGSTTSSAEPDPGSAEAEAWAELREQCNCVAPGCITSAAEIESTLCRLQTSTRALVRSTGCARDVDALLSLEDEWGDFYALENGALAGCNSTIGDFRTGIGSGLDSACMGPFTYCLPCPEAYTAALLSELIDAQIDAQPCMP